MSVAMEVAPGVYGAKRQSWHADNPREILRRLMMNDRDASENDMFNACWEAVRGKPGYMLAMYEHWFALNYRSLRPLVDDAEAASRLKTKKERAEASRAEINAAAQKFEEVIERRVQIRLTTLMPTGKMLRDSTREELVEIGGWATSLAEKLLPGQTVADSGLTAAQLTELWPA